MTNMDARQAVPETDPVDQLVPPTGGRCRLVVLIVATFVVLGLAAVAPVSGVVRPNVEFSGGESGTAFDGTGRWEYVVANEGWTTATIEHFDLGLDGVDVDQVAFQPASPTNAPDLLDPPAEPVAVRPSTTDPYELPPGEAVVVHLRFRYGCDRLGTTQRSTVRAHGVAPVPVTVELGSGSFGGPTSGLMSLLDFACTDAP